MQLGAWRIAALYFASRRVVKPRGVGIHPLWYRSTPEEAVGFELCM